MMHIPGDVAHWINYSAGSVLNEILNTGDLDKDGARKTLIWLNRALLEELKELKDARQNDRT